MVKVAKKSNFATRSQCSAVLRTKTEDLRTVVLRPAVIKAVFNGERLMLASDAHDGHENRAMRHQAYSQWAYYMVGATGSGKGIVVHACSVLAIGRQWPSATGCYTG